MGRHRVVHTCCIEETVWLDIRLLRAWGFLEAGRVIDGEVTWRQRRMDAGSVRVRIDLRNPRAMTLAVEAGEAFDMQTIELTRTPCRFGGWRYYFVCPRLGHRCEVLPLLDGEFASREAHGVTYGSQSEGELDRAYRKRDKLKARLDGRVNGRASPTGAKRRRLTHRWRIAADRARALRSDALRRRFGCA